MSFLDAEGAQSGYSLRGCFTMVVVFLVGITFCMGSVLIAADVSCVSNASTWLPEYPDAELVSQDYTMVRAFGIGETTRILYTEEDLGVVRRWYQDTITDLAVEGKSRVGVARSNWRVTEPEDGNGSLIILAQDCASGIF
ncbi:MAG: hypothetical protein RLP44_01265 [Aggregatilineales bacterium]